MHLAKELFILFSVLEFNLSIFNAVGKSEERNPQNKVFFFLHVLVQNPHPHNSFQG